MSQLHIVKATKDDTPDILDFIRQLAVYEKLEHEVEATVEKLNDTLFCDPPVAHVLFAIVDSEKVGVALYFYNYSTFLAKKGIYLEDLFVKPEHRGKGYGKSLLSKLASLCIEENCGRLEWSVLDWNTPSIKFYESLGAAPMDEWTVFRLTGDSLHALGADSKL